MRIRRDAVLARILKMLKECGGDPQKSDRSSRFRRLACVATDFFPGGDMLDTCRFEAPVITGAVLLYRVYLRLFDSKCDGLRNASIELSCLSRMAFRLFGETSGSNSGAEGYRFESCRGYSS